MADEADKQATPQPDTGFDKLTMSVMAEAQPLPPLGVSGVVLSKAQLLEALRVYVPNIVDFSPLPDGQHFYILFSQDEQPRHVVTKGG